MYYLSGILVGVAIWRIIYQTNLFIQGNEPLNMVAAGMWAVGLGINLATLTRQRD